MPSELDRAIARARRALAAEDAEARARMRRAYRLAIDRIETELRLVARQLADTPLPASWFDDRGRFTQTGELLYRRQRLQRLLPLAEAELRRFSNEAWTIIGDTRRAAISGGAATAAELAGTVGATIGLDARINTAATERLVAALGDGPLREVIDGYGTRAAEVIERALIQAVTTGEGPRQAVRRIMAEIGLPAVGDRLDTLTRTEMMRAFRGSLFDQYAAMGATQWRWVAVKSSRTCLACLAYDGRIFPMSKPFMAAHPRCRCIPSLASPAVAYESGADWLARQSPETQRRMFPSGASYDAYRDGRLTLDAFVGMRRSRVWGDSIRERSGREALGRVA